MRNKAGCPGRFPFFFILSFFFVPLSAFAQLGNQEVDVTFQYKPKITDAIKMDVPIVAQPQDTQKVAMKYTAKPLPADVKFKKSRLPAPSVKGPKIDELHHNFARLSFGNYSDIYGEYFYNSLRNRNRLFTAHLLHHSGTAPVSGSNFGINEADVYGRKLIGKTALEGNIGFSQDAYRWYGQTDSVNKPPYKRQAFSQFNIGAKLGNVPAPVEDFHYQLGAGYQHFADQFKTSESDISLSGSANQPIKDNSIQVKVAFDYMNYQFYKSNGRTLTTVAANYLFHANGIRLRAGFKTANESDSTGSEFHAYPDLYGEADILKNRLSVFATITGDLQKNSYQSMAEDNPWIMPGAKLLNTNKKFEIRGGLKGALNSRSAYKASIAYQNYRNMYFFVNDSANEKVFVPLYDSGTTTVLNFNFEFGYTVLQALNVNALLNVNNYSVSRLSGGNSNKPYQRPPVKALLGIRYNAQDKFIFTADAYVLSKRWTSVLGHETATQLPTIIDFNAGLTYIFTNLKGLQAFVEAQNLLNKKYAYWNFYPERGFQIRGGIKLSFL